MRYKIPDTIYATFNIVESDILGVKHYGLERIFKFGILKFPVMMKVYDGSWNTSRISSSWGKRWHRRREVIEKAIENDRSRRHDRYVEKRLK